MRNYGKIWEDGPETQKPKNAEKTCNIGHLRRNTRLIWRYKTMIKILFVCHGTTSISWDMPRGATINHVTHPNYYNFTTFLSSDMKWESQKQSRLGTKNAFSGTAFCLSAVFSKTCFSGRWRFLQLYTFCRKIPKTFDYEEDILSFCKVKGP